MCNASNKKLEKTTEGIELPNQEKEKENYKYLGVFAVNTIKQAEIKEEIRKEYLRRTRKLLETKL